MLIFEEGEEEYDLSAYPSKNVYLEVLDQQTVTTKELTALQKKYRAQRVVAELNGMQQVGDLYMRFPEDWAIAQEVMFADSTTIMGYNANMRNLVMDKLVGAQMVVFNRLTPGCDVMPFHKLARAANRRVEILYDYTDGSTSYDEDFALWYRDVTEEPGKYDGKTVRFKGQVAMLRRQKEGMFAPGRFVMTCCEADIQFCGIPCRYAEAASLSPKSWVTVTAKVSAEKHPLYKGEIGPVLTAEKVERNVSAAEPDVATF